MAREIVGKPGIVITHMCVDTIFRPLGRVTVTGVVARHLFWHGAFFVRKKEVAPVSATARDGPIINPRAWWLATSAEPEVFDVTTVVLLSLHCMTDAANSIWVGYNRLV
jgi:hypothetical protein